MATLIVTGGAGFIGSNAVDFFFRRGNRVVVVDKLTYAADVARLPPGIEVYKEDIVDLDWKGVIDRHKPQAVINFAAESHVDRSIQDTAGPVFINSNILGVYKIIQGLRAAQHRADFIQVSTDEVLGDFDLELETKGYCELDRLKPNNLYAATKASAELLIQSLYNTHKDFRYVIVRATNNYGPNQDLEKFIPTVVSSILRGKKVPIYGKGANIREWIWVEDFVRGIDAVLNMPKALQLDWYQHIFHFGSGARFSNLELARKIIDVMGVGQVEFVSDRPGHDRQYALYCGRAKGVLKWKPQQDLRTGLLVVIEDIRKRLGVK